MNIAEACTDISDGLIGDIKKISQQSNLCANIFCEKIPLSPPVKNILSFSKNKKKIWESILIGGEDYELVFSVAKTKIKKLSNESFFIDFLESFYFSWNYQAKESINNNFEK